MRRLTVLFVGITVLVAGIAGYYLGKAGLDKVNRQYQNERKLNRELHQALQYQKAVIFYTKSTDTDLFLQPVVRELKLGANPYQSVLNALFEGPSEKNGLFPIFPKGSEVISVNVKDGLAVVNLNQRAAQLNVGASGEVMAIGAIVNTLTKLPDVFKVRILIEGEEAESLAGHVDLTQAFTYDHKLLAPEYR